MAKSLGSGLSSIALQSGPGRKVARPLVPIGWSRRESLCQTLEPLLGWYHSAVVSVMANCDLRTPDAVNPSVAALHQLKLLVERDPVFSQALRTTVSTEDAAKLLADHGVTLTQAVLWRHRGTLVSGGLPTWRG